MARALRIEYEDAVYHVLSRGNERRRIYFSKTDYQKFLGYVAEAKKKYGIEIHSYALMKNHYHLVIETPDANLSKAMHHINSSYTTYINNRMKRNGHLFQGRYKAIVVSRDSYLAELSRYVHLNPVRAGMVKKPEEYPFSSYQTYVTDKNNELLTQDLILGLISGNKAEAKRQYRRFTESAIGEEEPDEILKNVYGGIILGGTRFIKETLGRIKGEYLSKEGITQRRALRTLHSGEEIIEVIAKLYKVKAEEIRKNKYREQRKIAIYLIKEKSGATNRQISELFDGMSCAAIAKTYERFKKEVKGSRKLYKEIAGIEKAIV
ncbi:chromosomal replication initiation protein [bacterium BMS3Abin10]|nr:chromosomal replication initiation protein [bacterium BMS3Abin10]GBE38126.1 chromosomal replication initiation protein [bacterium BMS3Bbin08]